MEGAILRALTMTSVSATSPKQPPGSKAERHKPKTAFKSRATGAAALRAEDQATVHDRIRKDIATFGLVASDIVRFRPRGAIDRRIKVEYLTDPEHSESVLLRLTPATAAELPAATVEEDLLSSQQAADLLNVSRPYLTKLADAGTFQGVVHTAAGHRRIPRAEVERIRDEMRSTRRAALDDMEEITKDLRIRELEAGRAKAKRRWVPKSA
ncbi:helix-turn-helix domain-containing protein [Piscinibacter sp.]|jgi:excisionase family DNA binding protein|uniref:helix-turn-helix domain-containing protein n=1 Tax=Piscinibacter sp. TaxID=1903157 RepID=UPI00355961B8